MTLRPISLRHARAFVAAFHRHHDAPQGGKFALAAWHDGVHVGVAIVGRPVSRVLDDGWTAEVIRVCTDGTRNASSFLYGAAKRASEGDHIHARGGRRCEPQRSDGRVPDSLAAGAGAAR